MKQSVDEKCDEVEKIFILRKRNAYQNREYDIAVNVLSAYYDTQYIPCVSVYTYSLVCRNNKLEKLSQWHIET